MLFCAKKNGNMMVYANSTGRRPKVGTRVHEAMKAQTTSQSRSVDMLAVKKSAPSATFCDARCSSAVLQPVSHLQRCTVKFVPASFQDWDQFTDTDAKAGHSTMSRYILITI